MVQVLSDRRSNARSAGGEEYEKRRKAILLAAASIFREKGYAAANGDDIAKKAGMDRASLYYYYAGKQEIFRDMVGEAVTDNVLMAEQIAGSTDVPERQLRRLIEGLFSSYSRHFPYLFVFVQEEMTRLTKDKSAWSATMRRLDKRFDDAIIKIIQTGVDAGSFTIRGDARLAAVGIIGMCNWSHRWFDPNRGHDGAMIAATFSDLVLKGMISRLD
ncbi:MAG TPA: TetR/AcrR family transcriptional regulator [Candidatus Acidoferrales bacterium]|jgi:AcrR family transcriptional regulator|nr:TetR/AcrR family transcriptional regulator [Candidatus Acidoferrales bacterium]